MYVYHVYCDSLYQLAVAPQVNDLNFKIKSNQSLTCFHHNFSQMRAVVNFGVKFFILWSTNYLIGTTENWPVTMTHDANCKFR